MIPLKVESAWKGTVDCMKCGIRDMVLFSDLNQEDFAQIHTPIDDLHYPSGKTLHVESQKAEFVSTIRIGMVKLVRNTADGRERIVRVLRQGDVIGLEALATGNYTTEAVTLTETEVCKIPIEVIKKLSLTSPRLHERLTEKWQIALKNADDWIADLNFGSASRRVSQLLLKMCDAKNSNISHVFSREDMGSMLDLKLETVSREVTKLIKAGYIRAVDKSSRRFEILDPTALEKIV